MSEFHIACLGDPRLGEHATSARPAWLWSSDASRVLWANPTGAAIFGAASPLALAARQFDTGQPAAAQIANLAPTLQDGAPPRVERLRAFGAGVGRTLSTLCSHIALPDGRSAILVVATEPAGPELALAERAARLLVGSEQPVAVFAADGRLLHAARAAFNPLGDVSSLSMLDADAIADAALRDGHASGMVDGQLLTLDRVGHDESTALFASLQPAPVEAQEPVQPVEPVFAETAASTPVGAVEPTAAIPAPEIPAVAPEVAPEPPQETPQETPTEAPPQSPAETPPETPGEAPRESPQEAPDEAPTTTPQETPQAPPQEAPTPPSETPPAEPSEAPPQNPQELPPEATPEAPQEPPVVEPPAADAPGDRRHPLRFVWQMDTDGHFTVGNGEFISVVGARTAALLGQPWHDISAELGLDPHGAMAHAIASRDTWSGIEVPWPVDGSDDRLTIELSGLPVFDRERRFGGYRGFGVCRDLARLATLARPYVHYPDPSAPTDMPAPAPERCEPPALQIVSPSENVVMFRPAPVIAEPKTPTLSPIERNAFRELARKLTERLKETGEEPEADPVPATPTAAPVPEREPEASQPPVSTDVPSPVDTDAGSANIAARIAELSTPAFFADKPLTDTPSTDERPILDRVPVGVLVHRLDSLLYANRAFLDWTGYADLGALEEAGGLETLFIDSDPDAHQESAGQGAGRTLTISTQRGDAVPVEGRLFSIPWDGEPAQVLMLVSATHVDKTGAAEMALRLATAETRELRAILDTAADGILVLDRDGRVLSANRSAEILFNGDAQPLSGKDFRDLLSAENRLSATEHFEALARQGAAMPGDGREVTGRSQHDRFTPLFMTMGRIDSDPPKFCAVFRNITLWKRSEEELIASRRQAEKASSTKSEFLAKVSHEIRTPLNAIIGFSEVMMEERFGPVGNERYREYLKDIHASGGHVVALVNDLLDLSKIEAGKLDLNFGSVDLNDLTQQCVAIMQPQANRERIIIRSSLSQSLPPILADARSVKQIVLNLVSNSIKFTGAGGQVIVSTARADNGEAVLRVRDTGVGMSEQDIATALEPFRQLATSARWGSGGTGLGLPLTKALAEANRAGFTISSAPNAGTLVEIAFPAARLSAE
jgi:PAS domain S-box-containing protein